MRDPHLLHRPRIAVAVLVAAVTGWLTVGLVLARPAPALVAHGVGGTLPSVAAGGADRHGGARRTRFTGPVVTLAYHPDMLDVTQGSATLSYSTPAYVTMDEPRSATLFYASGQAAPMAFVQMDVTDAGSPQTYSIRVRDPAGNWLTSEQFQTAASGTNRLAVQWDASSTATSSIPITIVVRSYYAGGSFIETTTDTRVLVINQKTSPYGRGWTIAGLMRLVIQSNGIVVTDGAGGAVFYLKSGSSWITPAGEFSTLTFDGTYYRLTAPDGSQAIFYSDGKLWKTQDRLGVTTTFAYNASGNLGTVTDPAGKAMSFGYTFCCNTLTSITDPAGRVSNIIFSNDGANEYYTFRDPTGTAALYTVQALVNDRLLSFTDRGGNTSDVTYDAVGTVASIAAPQVSTSDAGLTRPTAQFVSLRRAVLPASGGTSGSPAAALRADTVRISVTDPRGNTTRLQVDRFGLPLRIEEPLGRVTTIERDTSGRVTRAVEPSGHAVRQIWHGVELDTLLDETTGDSVFAAYEATYHQPTHVWGDGTTETWNYYGTLGILDSTRSGTSTSPVTKFTWDALGRIASVTDGEGHGTYYAYVDGTGTPDASTKNLRSASVGSAETTYRRLSVHLYDAVGRDSIAISPDNDTTRTTYNVLNWVTGVVDPRAGATTYQYTTLGQLYILTDPKGQTYTYNRNALGWVQSEIDPRLYSTSYSYDRNGNATQVTPRRGSSYQVSVAYDALNRVSSRTADGQTTTFSYASDDRWMKGSNAASTDSVAVDAAGRPTLILTRRGSSTYTQTPTYDTRGLLTQLSVTGPWSGAHTVGYHYDSKLQLDTLTEFGGGKTGFQYNADGMETLRLWNGGAAGVGRDYTSVHVPASVSTYSGYMESFRFDFNVNTDGLVGARIGRYSLTNGEAGQLVRSYSYDRLGRITKSEDRKYPDSSNLGCDPGAPPTRDVGGCIPMGAGTVVGTTKTFSWDSAGNPRHGSAVVGTGNRLTSFNGFTLEYDADGNLTRKATTGWEQTFAWNSLGQLASTTVNGSTVYFYYDAFGRWIRRDQPGVSSVEYVYDGDDLLLERDGSGNLIEYTYLPGVDEPHSMRRNGTTYYYQTDFPGNVIQVLDASGNVVDRYSYTPFGQTENSLYNPTSETVPNLLKFAGRQYEPTSKLYQMRARWYDPDIQRFISEDPIGLQGGVNLFVYSGNTPTNLHDPTGLDPECPEGYVLTYFINGPGCVDGKTGSILVPGVTGGGHVSPYAGPYTYDPNKRNHNPWAAPAPELRHGRGWCRGGFDEFQCDALRSAVEFLRDHPLPYCREMGFNAQVRLYSGRYAFNPGLANYRGKSRDGLAHIDRGDPLLGIVEIAASPFTSGVRAPWFPGRLPNTLAHEEGHFAVGGGHAFDGTFTGTPSPLGAPDQIGNACGTIPASVPLP